MKKLIVTILILTVALFIFTPSSFAKKDNGQGNGALVCPGPEDGNNIQGLVFPLSDVILPLPVGEDLLYLEITYVVVESSGSELIVLTPSGQYNYHATLYNDLAKGTINADAFILIVDEDGNFLVDENGDLIKEGPVQLVFEFETATLNEHFNIYDADNPYVPVDCSDINSVNVPLDTVNLFFKVKDAALFSYTDVNGDTYDNLEGEPFDLNLKLKHGDVQFIRFK